MCVNDMLGKVCKGDVMEIIKVAAVANIGIHILSESVTVVW